MFSGPESGLINWLHRCGWRFWMIGNQGCRSTRGKNSSVQFVRRNRQVPSQRGIPLPNGTCQGAVIPSQESTPHPPLRTMLTRFRSMKCGSVRSDRHPHCAITPPFPTQTMSGINHHVLYCILHSKHRFRTESMYDKLQHVPREGASANNKSISNQEHN